MGLALMFFYVIGNAETPAFVTKEATITAPRGQAMPPPCEESKAADTPESNDVHRGREDVAGWTDGARGDGRTVELRSAGDLRTSHGRAAVHALQPGAREPSIPEGGESSLSQEVEKVNAGDSHLVASEPACPHWDTLLSLHRSR